MSLELKINLNRIKIESLEEFEKYGAGYNNLEKESVFIIQNGTNNAEKLIEAIKKIDISLTDHGEPSRLGYYRIHLLDSFIEAEDRELYLSMYDDWKKCIDEGLSLQIKLPFTFENSLWDAAFKCAFLQLSKEYSDKMKTEMKLRNFMVIMFNWIKLYFPKVFLCTRTLSQFPKLVYVGIVRTNEFLFFRLMALCGCDVFCINPYKKSEIKWDNISDIAQVINENEPVTLKIPEYDREKIIQEYGKKEHQKESSAGVSSSRELLNDTSRTEQTALSYETLANLASSIVMINVLNENGESFATGSGVLVNDNGYILTNYHVVAGGYSFAVRLEEEEDKYYTGELVKCHSSNDLALLRIQGSERKAIPVYTGSPLVRGQQVVAIGSPLGLFNTVSDGIIAGFRKFENLSMIQFTAPISHGSSGGALLNLFGQLIGIVTAGFDDGQNLNLAVDYETVTKFLRGFI